MAELMRHERGQQGLHAFARMPFVRTYMEGLHEKRQRNMQVMSYLVSRHQAIVKHLRDLEHA